MYDTCIFWLEQEAVSNTNLLAVTPSLLTNVGEHYKNERESFSGQLRNLKVSVHDSGISIRGSMARYFLNDNFQTLQRQDMQRAIEQLSDELRLPITEAKVTRTDISQNFVMDYKPESYFYYLGDSRYYNRLPQEHTLYYRNGERTKLFYNKIEWGRAKGIDVPEIWTNDHVLRYEYRLMKRIPKRFNKALIQAKDLYDEEVYMHFIDEYVEEYENIVKNSLINFNIEHMNSPKDFIKQLAMLKIQEIGQNNVMDLIEDMRAKGVFANKEYYSRLKKEIRTLSKLPKVSESSEMINELTQKIRAVKSNYR